MLLRAILPLLIVGASASPHPRPSSGLYQLIDDGVGGGGEEKPCKPGTVCKGFQQCNVLFDDAKNKTANKMHWIMTGADDYLRKDLLKDDTKGWAERLFKQSGIGGSDTSTSYDCTRLTKYSCGNTQECEDYEPYSAYWVHKSMVNYNSFFTRLHEQLQDTGIWQLSKGIKDITSTFGDLPEDMSPIFGILIGIFVSGAALAGPTWQVAAPLTAVVGALNIASAAYAKSKGGEVDQEKELEKVFGDVFINFSKALEETARMFFSGDFTDSGKNVTGKDLIADAFSDGKMVDNDRVNEAMDVWVEKTANLIDKILIVEALKKNDYYVQRIYEISEEECLEHKGLWFDEMCNRIGTSESMTPFYTVRKLRMPDDMFKAFTEKYHFDYKETILNAIECDGGKPSMPDWMALDDPKKLPRCLMNFEVKKQKLGDCFGQKCVTIK